MTDDARDALHRAMEQQTYSGRKVPEHLRDGIVRYIVDHRRPGRFLEAVFCNSLTNAIMHADSISCANLNAIVLFVYNEAPSACWGDRQAFIEWLALREA